MRATISAVIRGLGTTYVDGAERMEIHIPLENATSFPHVMNMRIPVQLNILGTQYHGGVRATPNNRYVWICPDIRKMSHEPTKLSRALADAGLGKNDRVHLDVDGSSITVRPAY